MKRFLIPIIISLVLVACNNNEVAQGGISNQIVSSIDITNGVKDLYVSPKGSLIEFTVMVQDDCALEVYYGEGWCNLESGTKLKTGLNRVAIRVKPCVEWKSISSDGSSQRRVQLIYIRDSYDDVVARLRINQDYPYFMVQDDSGEVFSEYEFPWYVGKADGKNQPKRVKIKSNVEWKIKYLPNWLSCNLTSGNSTMQGFEVADQYDQTEFDLELVPQGINIGDANYSQTLSFVGTVNNTNDSTSYTHSITFSQENLVFVVNGVTDYEFSPIVKSDYMGESFSILSPNVGWEIANYPSWMDISPMSGSANDAPQNITIKPRKTSTGVTDQTGTIEIAPIIGSDIKVNGVSKFVNVKQLAYEMKLTPTKYVFENNQDGTINITANASGAWRLYQPNVSSWLNCSPEELTGVGKEYGGADGQMTISLAERNYQREPLTTTLKLQSVEPGATSLAETVNVEQAGYVLDLKTSLKEIPVSGIQDGSNVLTVSSSGDWRIETDVNWVTVEQQSGNSCNNRAVALSATENTYNYNREATITLISKTHEDNGKTPLKSELKLTQRKYIFEVSETNLTFGAVNPASSSFKDVEVRCSASKWNVEFVNASDKSWVTVSPTSGTSDGKIRISVTNNSGAKRTCNLRVSNPDKPSDIKTISVTQEAYVFKVEDLGSGSIPAAATTVDFSDMQRSFSVECSPGITYSVSCSNGKVSGNTVIFDYNPNNQNRKVYVEFTPSFGDIKRIELNQFGLIFNLDDQEIMSTFTAKQGEQLDFNYLQPQYAWEIVVKSDWLDIVDSAGKSVVNTPFASTNKESYTIITTKDNISSQAQKGEIWVALLQSKTTDGQYGIYKRYFINRAGIELTTNLIDNTWISSQIASTKDVTVTSDFDWSVSLADSSLDWISVEKSSTNKFSISVKKNETGAIREAKIYLDSEYYQSSKDARLRKEILVIQNP